MNTARKLPVEYAADVFGAQKQSAQWHLHRAWLAYSNGDPVLAEVERLDAMKRLAAMGDLILKLADEQGTPDLRPVSCCGRTETTCNCPPFADAEESPCF